MTKDEFLNLDREEVSQRLIVALRAGKVDAKKLLQLAMAWAQNHERGVRDEVESVEEHARKIGLIE